MVWKFTEWYDKNKGDFNAKRKSRYHTDEAYREQVKARSAQRRQRLKSVPSTGRSVTDICGILEITPWALSRWRTMGYIPVDNLKTHQFTDTQINLIGMLRDFMLKIKRHTPESKAQLNDVINVIHHNWNV
jgi:hypothetical protein